jgi:hypothetical protein
MDINDNLNATDEMLKNYLILFTALMILQDGAMNLWFIYPVKWALVM